MPVIHDLADAAHGLDPEDSSATIVTVGVMTSAPVALGMHRHRKAQLLLQRRGVLTCGTEGRLWLVPPNGAIWIPPDLEHSIDASGPGEGYSVLIDPAAVRQLPKACCTLSVSPLLRELVIRSASLPPHYPARGAEARLCAVLLDEIAAAPLGGLYLPMPDDPRLRGMIGKMMAAPATRDPIAAWARGAGLSERSLARILSRETGMSFGQWRRRLAVLLALQWIAAGASVQNVAADLGYQSTGSFVTMFRKTLGAPPARYFAQRTGEGAD